jgi:hypothetical protein
MTSFKRKIACRVQVELAGIAVALQRSAPKIYHCVLQLSQLSFSDSHILTSSPLFVHF